MTAILLQFWPYIAGVAITLYGLWRARQSGINAERARQANADLAARDIRDQVQNDVGALPADAARERLGTWSKP